MKIKLIIEKNPDYYLYQITGDPKGDPEDWFEAFLDAFYEDLQMEVEGIKVERDHDRNFTVQIYKMTIETFVAQAMPTINRYVNNKNPFENKLICKGVEII